ncbi:hypothetical protein C1646_672871 [Rhizophagus diaphanus]|nr:hypothetical protein C1646_672871 [Rhizophagus diaphanus] [Rhizophagus sp. MUCL 43196]
MGYDINDQKILIAQMLNFKDKQDTYTVPFVKKHVMPRTWWMSCDDQPPYLKQLALKMFLVVPHSTSFDYNENNNNEDGYEKIFETQIPNHEVYVLIEDNVDLTNAIFLNNKEEEEDEIYN